MSPVIPFITIYSRHGKIPSGKNKGKPCPHGATENQEADESFLDCNCRKHLRWTDPETGEQIRRPAKTRSKAVANEVKAALEREMRGDPEPEFNSTGGISIASAISQFKTAKRLEGVTNGTLGGYNPPLARLLAFCEAPKPLVGENQVEIPLKPVSTLNAITDEHMLSFAQSWDTFWPKRLTQKLNRGIYVTFFRYCIERKWIQFKPLMPKISNVNDAPTMPLNDDETARLFAAIPGAIPENERMQTVIRSLFLLQLYSGLAITDALILPRSGLKWDAEAGPSGAYVVETARIKTGKEVCNAIPTEVAEEILATPNSNPQYIFWNGTIEPRSFSQNFYKYIRKVFKAGGIDPGENRMKAHRLRDTFAVNLLAKGVVMDDVAKALGDTLAVTEKSYAKWVPKRQKRHHEVIIATFDKSSSSSEAAEREMLARLKAKYEPPAQQKVGIVPVSKTA